MVRDNRVILDSMAGITVMNPPYTGHLTPSYFHYSLLCRLLNLIK